MIEEDIKRAIGRIVRLLDPYFFNRYQNIGLKADRSMFIDGVPALLFIRADKDGDGDYDPLIAATWENSTKSGSGTINWNTVFGVPSAAKAVLAVIIGNDGTTGSQIALAAKSTTTVPSLYLLAQGAGIWNSAQGVVAIAADGTSYYSFNLEWDVFYLRVVGWYI